MFLILLNQLCHLHSYPAKPSRYSMNHLYYQKPHHYYCLKFLMLLNHKKCPQITSPCISRVVFNGILHIFIYIYFLYSWYNSIPSIFPTFQHSHSDEHVRFCSYANGKKTLLHIVQDISWKNVKILINFMNFN